MGKQSARIFFNGKDHKEIYMDQNYHSQLYKADDLLWKKLEDEEPLDYFAMKVADYMADYQTGEMPTSGEPGYVQLTITGDYEIDWGDGTITNTKNHTYSTSNGTEYTIKIKGNIKTFAASASYKSAICSCVTEVLTPLLRGMSKTSYNEASGGKPSLASMFAWTPLLRKVPSNLLKNHKDIEGVNASSIFNNSGIREIPQRLFSGVKGWLIGNAFTYCNNLETVPPNVFANATFSTTGTNNIFSNCPNLKYVYDYPVGILPNFTGTALEEVDCRFIDITTAENAFSGLKTLRRIGANLFVDSPNITTFEYCFYDCGSLEEIPQGLFDGQESAENFRGCFGYNYAITNIPNDLFDDCTSASDFQECFRGCRNVTSNVPELWNTGAVGNVCYQNCVNAANYNDIPSGWK